MNAKVQERIEGLLRSSRLRFSKRDGKLYVNATAKELHERVEERHALSIKRNRINKVSPEQQEIQAHTLHVLLTAPNDYIKVMDEE